ncbi:TRAP transporter substrate-binding protein [Halomonas sp. 328]|uniref:TRAP transporter substrate-binding protein n=1 Tax=Halomonas sp. 328 TaxID=2776704 RepID=UPI0018A7CBFD|nr:TRAP transporter substrate-binding protein [Halomonas sp. 328]MBF8221994.1 TRAP transporter substrate-binding protein [Halomonas sp. 328]
MTQTKTLLTATLAAALSLSALNAQARDLRLGLITPATHQWSQAAERFAADLEVASDGAYRISVHPAQQLGNEAEMVQQLQGGTLDMAFLTLAELSNWIPDFGALYAPYLVDGVDQAAALLRTDAARELLELMPQGMGLVGVGYGMAGMRQVLSRDPIESASDLRGKTLRITPFEPILDFYLAAGSAPIPLPLPAVYDALANGQVDAIDMDFDSILMLNFHEQANHLLISNHMMFPMVGVMSGQLWRDLSEDGRELIQDTMNRHLDEVISTYQQQDAEQEAELRRQDIEVVEADRAVFQEVIAAWEATWNDKAPSLAALRETAAALNLP